MRSSHSLDRLQVAFDDDHSVANAGLILSATLLEHLGLEQLFDEHVDLGNRDGHFLPGRKAMTIVQALVAGADSIDDCGVLRAGETEKVLSHKVMAPSTLGTFLRAFSFGHVRQLDKIAEEALGRAWAAGTGPGEGPLVIDVDSTICPLHGYHKQGAAYGYTKVLGHHPLLATRAGTGEVLHVRHRKGSANTARGAPRFLKETFGRVRRAGAAGEITLRADSGFCSKQVIAACRTSSVHFSITVRQTTKVKAAIAEIDESSWVGIDYTPGEIAEVAETTYKGDRLIVRRVRGPLGPRTAVPHLVLPRLCHRPRRPSHRARPVPPRARTSRARDQGAEGERAGSPSLGELFRQCRLGRACHPRPQPHLLGRLHRS